MGWCEQRIFADLCGAKSARVAVFAALALTFGALEMNAQADFQAEADLVVLHVSVADHEGKVVRDLPKSAFRVYEDGAEQNVSLFRREDTPVAVGLLIDNSGSMVRKLPDVIAATDTFARSCNPEDQMFIVNFNERVSLGLPPAVPFVSDPEKLKASMLRIYANGQTALYDAIAMALDHIRQSTLQKKVLIVLSDGGDNASARRFPEVFSMVQQSDVIIYTVGLFDEYNTDRNPGVLKQLAQASGGEAFLPKEIPKVTNVLQSVSRDIRNQYTVGYIPRNGKQDGTFRNVHVVLVGPHAERWIVHTRPGYFAAAPGAGAIPGR